MTIEDELKARIAELEADNVRLTALALSMRSESDKRLKVRDKELLERGVELLQAYRNSVIEECAKSCENAANVAASFGGACSCDSMLRSQIEPDNVFLELGKLLAEAGLKPRIEVPMCGGRRRFHDFDVSGRCLRCREWR